MANQVYQEDLIRGINILDQYWQCKEMLKELQAQQYLIEKTTKGYLPLSEKEHIWRGQDAIKNTLTKMGSLLSLGEDILSKVVYSFDGSKPAFVARDKLSETYYRLALEAELDGDNQAFSYFISRCECFDDNCYLPRLCEPATLNISIFPFGARIILKPLHENGFMIEESDEATLLNTSLRGITLEQGRYVLCIDHDGYNPTRVPVLARRGESIDLQVSMLPTSKVPSGFVHIAAGEFIEGGDPDTRGWSLPSQKRWVGDFMIAIHPVTTEEYIMFLEAIFCDRPEEALARRPRAYPEKGYYVSFSPDGKVQLPQPGQDGQEWTLDLPVFGVSYDDALAYCSWLSKKDRVAYRLPTEHEWEKSARGVDGRWFPWGNRFDPSLCNMRDSREQGPGPVPVGEYATDCSVYGVRGMAGNVRDWTSSTPVDDFGEGRYLHDIAYRRWHEASEGQVIRGGAWSPLVPRLADRYWIHKNTVLSFLGFRLAISV